MDSQVIGSTRIGVLNITAPCRHNEKAHSYDTRPHPQSHDGSASALEMGSRVRTKCTQRHATCSALV